MDRVLAKGHFIGADRAEIPCSNEFIFQGSSSQVVKRFDEYTKNTPKDGVVDRIQVVRYLRGAGMLERIRIHTFTDS